MKSFIHILHLEDNPADAELIQATLESADLTCQITRVQSREDFTQAIYQEEYDLILADYHLPDYDGMSALRLAQERCPETPFIFVSGVLGEDAAIEALTQGAIDYVLKHKLSRLVPAVTRALREAENRKERQWAEAALRDSEARYRRITEAITDYLYTVRVVEGQAMGIRHGLGCLAVTGYTEEEFAADPNLWIRMVVADDRPAVQDQARRVLAGEPAPAIEHRIVRKDGAVRWVCNTPVPRRDGQGVLQSYDGLIQDITGRKQAEEALRESERLLADIAANYPNSYLSIVEQDFTIGFTSGQEFKKQHLDPKSFEGLSLEQVFGEQTSIVREQYRKAFQGEETSFELFIHNQHQLYNVVPLYDQHGHVTRILAVVENITERKRVEEEIKGLAKFPSENPNPVLRVAKDGTVLYANTASMPLLNTWGCQEGQPLPEDKHAFMLDVLSAGSSKMTEVVCKDRILSLTFTPVVDADYVNVYGLDITKRKQAEETLHLNESRLEALLKLSHMTDMSLHQIADFVLEEAVTLSRSTIGFLGFLDADEQMMTLHAWSKDVMEQCAIVDKPLHFPLDNAGLWGEAIRQRRVIMINDYSVPDPHKKGYPEGHVPLRRLLNIPVFEGDRIVAITTVGNKEEEYDESDVRQITLLTDGMWRYIQHKQTEEALWKSEERLRLTLEAAQIGIWDWDIQHDRWYASPIYYTMLGYEPKEGLADRNEWLERLHPDDRDMVYAKIQHVLARNFQEYRYEARMRHADGAYRWVFVVGFKIQRDQDGQVTRMLGIRMDITDRKQAEQELATYREHLEELVAERTAALEQEILERKRIEHALQEAKDAALEAQRAAEAANRAKSEFLANMSHELRTPLNAILGYAQLLKRETNLTAKQQEQLTTIHSSGQHLVTLISDLLDLGRIEAQRMDVEVTTFNLPAFLRSILDASRLKAEAKSLFVRYEEVSPVPALVRGDDRKLRQVLLNLLTNAVKYTKLGGVTLRVSSQQSPVSSQQSPVAANLLFEVEDTGIGISEEQLEAIFDPFTQMKGADRSSEGVGLGLAICRRLIELMGGRLLVDSEVGTGSTFTVELELEVLEAVETAATEPEKVIIGYQGERKRLLIVDDNITNLAMLVSVLEPLGFAIETADSGEEALQKAAATLPDLILLDLLMPGMDGDEALRQIRRTEGLEHVNVIGVSAAIADKERTGRFAAACDGFLAKPIDIKELQEQLKEHLQIEWIEEEAEATAAPTSTEVPPVDEGEPEKWPSQAVVEKLLKKAEWGDFTRLERILDRLEAEDEDYKGFCDKIRAYSKRFDDDAILNELTQ